MASTRSSLYALAETGDNAAFLANLAAYPQGKSLNIGTDTASFFNPRYKVLLEITAKCLDPECCRELMARSGFWSTLDALNIKLSDGHFSQGLLDICQYQSFDLIAEVFNTYHIFLKFPEGKDSFLEEIMTNSNLSPEQKVKLIKLTDVIFSIKDSPRNFALDNPQQFLEFYQKHRIPIMPPGTKPQPLKIDTRADRKRQEDLRREHENKMEAYQNQQAMYKKWYEYNEPIIRGLETLLSVILSDDTFSDYQIYDELASHHFNNGNEEQAFAYWGIILATKFPTYTNVNPVCIDYLLHKPESFTNYLSKGQCKFIGQMLALEHPEYFELHADMIPDLKKDLFPQAHIAHMEKVKEKGTVAEVKFDIDSKEEKLYTDSILTEAEESKKRQGESKEEKKEEKKEERKDIKPLSLDSETPEEEESKLWWNSQSSAATKEKLSDELMSALQTMIGECINAVPPMDTRFFGQSAAKNRLKIMLGLSEIQNLLFAEPDNFLFKIIGICSELLPNLRQEDKKTPPYFILKSVQQAAITLTQINHELMPMAALRNELYDMEAHKKQEAPKQGGESKRESKEESKEKQKKPSR